MVEARRISFSDIVGETTKIVRANPGIVLIYALGMAALTLALQAASTSAASSAVPTVVTIIASFFLTEAFLVSEGQLSLEGRKRRIGAYIGATLLAGLGMLAGMVLLILPGLILLAFAGLFAGLLIVVALLSGVEVALFGEDSFDVASNPLTRSAGANVLGFLVEAVSNLAVVGSTAMSVAIAMALRPSRASLENVFR